MKMSRRSFLALSATMGIRLALPDCLQNNLPDEIVDIPGLIHLENDIWLSTTGTVAGPATVFNITFPTLENPDGSVPKNLAQKLFLLRSSVEKPVLYWVRNTGSHLVWISSPSCDVIVPPEQTVFLKYETYVQDNGQYRPVDIEVELVSFMVFQKGLKNV